jgi:hypothetical protein
MACHFWEHRFFSSVESFPSSPYSSSPVFTNISFDLLPETTDLDAGMTSSPDDITTVDPNAPAPPVDPPTLEPDILVPHHSTRVTTFPSHLCDYHCYSALATLHEPHSFCEAHTNPLWQNAMSEELNALSKTHTWDLVDVPPGKTVVGCKWVYKIKTKSDGSISDTRHILWQRGSIRSMVLIMRRIMCRWLALLLFDPSLLWLLCVIGIFFKWM